MDRLLSTQRRTSGVPLLPALAWVTIMASLVMWPLSRAVGAPAPPPPLPAPQATADPGLSVLIREVAGTGQRMTLTFDAIDASTDRLSLADSGEPLLLTDEHGGQWRSADQPLALDALNTGSFRVEMVGPQVPPAGQLTLHVNDGRTIATTPQLTVGPIAFTKGKRTDFAPPPSRSVPMHGQAAYHPDGVSLVVRRIDVFPGLVEVSVLVVNGNSDRVALINDPHDAPYIEDDLGRRSALIPPADDADLSIPGRQRLSGVLRFAGGVSRQATRLSLHINDRYGSADDPNARSPKLELDGLDLGTAP